MAPPLGPLTYEDVTKVYREEKKSAGLTSVRHDFYPAIRVLMDQLKRDYEREAASDSYGAKARQLDQQIAKMGEKVLQIFDIRADKIMHMAILGAAGGKLDHSRLTEEERKMLESSLVQVREMRNALLDMPRPGNMEFTRMNAMPMPEAAEAQGIKVEDLVPAKEPEEAVRAEAALAEPTLAEVPKKEKAPAKETEPVEVALPTPEAQKPGKGVVLLRILEDIPPFAGPSGTFTLGKEDIVTLPAGIGKALVKRGKAVEIAIGPL